IGNDQFILQLASSAAGRSWSLSQGFDGMGDLVSQARLHVQRSAVSPLIDVPTFLARLKEIATNTKNPDEAVFVGVFMEAWENSEDRLLDLQNRECCGEENDHAGDEQRDQDRLPQRR